MSLLLDALQRASKEKEKAASSAAPAPSPPIVLEPLAMETPAPAPDNPVAKPAGTPVVEPALTLSLVSENESHPPPAPASAVSTPAPSAVPEKVEPTLAPPAQAITPPEPSPRIPPPPPAAPKPPLQPAKPAAPPAPKPAAPAPEKPVPPRTPQVAREILYASAKPQPSSRKRQVLFGGIALVLALSLGSLFLFEFLNQPSRLSPASPPPQPVATATDTASPPAAAVPPALPVPAKAQTGSTAPEPSTKIPAATPAPTQATTSAADTPKAPAVPAGRDQPLFSGKPVFVAKPGGSQALDAAYAALNEGRLEAAAEAYRRALRNNPEERDALLGLAHIAHRQGQRDEARAWYQRVLRLEPDHPAANAGLLALSEGDLETTVSRARDMADKNPESAAAQSALGNALAREGLLAEAQQAFFKAVTLEPDQPLHTFNLAVALDRLHKYDLARTYYERALTLAEKAGNGLRKNFPRDAALNRLEQLRARSANATGSAP